MSGAMTRRDFLRVSGGATAAMGLAGLPPGLVDRIAFGDQAWNPIRQMSGSAPEALTLRAAVGSAEVGAGVVSPAWMLNQSLPSPLLRVRQGDRFRVTLDNQLPEEMILHWHGLTPPEASDGHPRLAVAPGGRYDYDFEVENRAGPTVIGAASRCTPLNRYSRSRSIALSPSTIARHNRGSCQVLRQLRDSSRQRWCCRCWQRRAPKSLRRRN